MKLNIKYLREYRAQETGTLTYVYGLKGSASALKAYKTSQGKFYREDDKTSLPLFFTTKYAGELGNIQQSSKGKWFVDMSEFDKANSLCEQYKDTAFGKELASAVVTKLLGNPVPTQDVPHTEVKPERIESAESEDLSDM